MNSESVVKRLNALKTLMKQKNIDYYLIPTGDYHGSEYVSEYFKVREYFSGFTGSNGTLLIGPLETCLWTDGRYFIQAEKELEYTGIFLQKIGEKDVPTIGEYLKARVKGGENIGFDGKVVTAAFGRKLEQTLQDIQVKFYYEEDLADELWIDRPTFKQNEVIVPEDENGLFGMTTVCKVEKVREKMKEANASVLVLSKLDDIMWLFNIRGKDVECNPVAFSFAIITMTEVFLYVGEHVINAELLVKAKKDGVTLKPYHSFLENLKTLNFGEKIWLCENSTPYAVYKSFDEKKIYFHANPTELFKAVKNETELQNIREFYLKDSVAVTKFIFKMKKERERIVQGKSVTEYDAMLWMDELRKEIPGFLDKSFTTISAYGENAAMMHYESTKESCAFIKNEGMLLVDSGGQYLGATTDVTRTIAMGTVTEEMKLHFTKVAEGMLSLANARFMYGCTGRNLDILARKPLWEIGIDYKCGTGHGVGYILNVHEGPQNIRYRYVEGVGEAVLEEGMLVTDEPGVYIKGQYGIRTENVLLVQMDFENEDGQFMKFEMLTFVPIDLELIDTKNLDEKTKDYLNEYHRQVYEKVSPHLNEEERNWLKENTKNVDSFY